MGCGSSQTTAQCACRRLCDGLILQAIGVLPGFLLKVTVMSGAGEICDESHSNSPKLYSLPVRPLIRPVPLVLL